MARPPPGPGKEEKLRGMFSSGSGAAQHAQRWEPLWAAGLQPGELSVHC